MMMNNIYLLPVQNDTNVKIDITTKINQYSGNVHLNQRGIPFHLIPNIKRSDNSAQLAKKSLVFLRATRATKEDHVELLPMKEKRRR